MPRLFWCFIFSLFAHVALCFTIRFGEYSESRSREVLQVSLDGELKQENSNKRDKFQQVVPRKILKHEQVRQALVAREATGSPESIYYSSDAVDVKAIRWRIGNLLLPEVVSREGLHGQVEVAIYLNELGGVDRVDVVKSSYPGLLEKAAVDAILDSGFTPAYKSGVPVRSVKRTLILFNPDQEAVPIGVFE